MSQSFKLKYDLMQENDPTNKDAVSEHQSKAYEEFYPEENHVRQICFVWLDGKRIFMNYSYLVSGEYLPEANRITLTFTTHVFILNGVNLETLFYDIMNQLSKQITCIDARYNLIGEDEKPVVNEIVLKK